MNRFKTKALAVMPGLPARGMWRLDFQRLYRRLKRRRAKALPTSMLDGTLLPPKPKEFLVHMHVCGLPLSNSTIAPLNKALVGYLCKRDDGHPGVGVGFAAPRGTPVRAVQSGSVLNIGWDDGYGTYIDIVHDDGAQARYGHLERIASRIRAGVRISNGQAIGTVGTTGCCDRPQLHFSVLLSTGQSCDALDYLNILDCLRPA